MCLLTLLGWRLGGRCFRRYIAGRDIVKGRFTCVGFWLGGWLGVDCICLYFGLRVYACVCVCAGLGRYIDLKIDVEGLDWSCWSWFGIGIVIYQLSSIILFELFFGLCRFGSMVYCSASAVHDDDGKGNGVYHYTILVKYIVASITTVPICFPRLIYRRT